MIKLLEAANIMNIFLCDTVINVIVPKYND